jgi:protein kinase-like protein
VVHRDVKPQNILLDEQGSLHLTDFGFAGCVEEEHTRLTQDGAVMGTPLYMSPEQASGDTASVGPASDLYSTGVVLYELLAGRTPFTAPHASGLAYQIVHTAPPSPSLLRPGLDAGLEAICLKALAKRPEGRFGSGEEMAAALTAWGASGVAPAASSGAPPSGEAETQAYRPDRRARRSGRWKWVAAAGLLLPVLALAATERAGITHLLGTIATTAHPTTPGGEPAPRPGASPEKSEGDVAAQLTKDAVVLMNFEQNSFYEKNGKTYVRDLSGQGNDGLCDGVAYTPNGKAGGGLLCQGGSLRFAKSFINRQRNYTITGWCRSDGPLKSLYVASAPDLTDSVFDVQLPADRTLWVQAWNASQPKNWIGAATDPGDAPTGWFFFAASLAEGETGSGKLRIVIDDRILERPSQVVWASPRLKIVDTLGRGSDEAAFDELAVFNRALSDQEIMAIRALGLKGIPFGPN